ncbi:cobalamin binding intrinsic factor-like, partial [Mobula hypostoma]|uniref:cobalamin binding intrinsic factor-like n=1 Tax=Mobula hypostoma TaxID=723540 RepID=UPI002FC2E24D
VDTGAVATLALWCVRDRNRALSVSAVARSLRILVDRLLSEVRPDGLIGNVYSTGLAVQALSLIQDLIPAGSWNCSRSLERLLLSAKDGSLKNPQAASQVTPSLEGRTYLDVGAIDCREDQSNLTLPDTTTPAAPVTSGQPDIRVCYNVTDGLGGTFSDRVLVRVPSGSILLRVMEAARDLFPQRFSFQYKMTLWGPSLYSVRGLEASSEDRTYWSLRSGSRPLEQGIGDYVPSDGETIVVILSRY